MNTPTTKPRGIRVIAICVFRREESILVFAGYDSVKETSYYRPLGGGVEPGETTRAAVAREIAEELGLQIDALKLLGVLENIFVLDGQPKHEIVFVYDGRFVDATIYDRQELHGWEANGEPLRAVWRRLDSFDEEHRLVPESLWDLLEFFIYCVSRYLTHIKHVVAFMSQHVNDELLNILVSQKIHAATVSSGNTSSVLKAVAA